MGFVDSETDYYRAWTNEQWLVLELINITFDKVSASYYHITKM